MMGKASRLSIIPSFLMSTIPRQGKGRFSQTLIQIKNLTITHRKDFRVLLDHFSCVFNDGDKAVLIGEEGNGKSTLLKWIYDPAMIEDYAVAEGERILQNAVPGYLPQELPAEDREKTVYEYFSESPVFFDQSPGDLAKMAAKFHFDLEFYYSSQRMGSLSGGERVKAQLLRVLMARPDVLLLDEPSNDIDIETLEWMEDFIRSWQGIVIFISHDETLIRQTANMIIHLEQLNRKMQPRATIVHTDYDTYVSQRADSFARQEQQAENDRREKKKRDERYREIREKVDHAQASISRQDPFHAALLKKKMHSVKSMEKRFSREDEAMTERPEQESAIFFKMDCTPVPAGKTILDFHRDELRSKSPSDEDSRVLARDIHLLVRGPEKVCIIGQNGAGKSTLLKQIYEEMKKRSDIHLEYMPQNYEELLDMDMTPVDFLDKSGDKEERSRIRTYLGSLMYTADEMGHAIRDLSGGQKAKIFLLKMSLSGADVLLLDEPTRNFSPLSNPVIRRMLSGYPGAIISVSHDRLYIQEVADTVYRLTENGLIKVR